MKYEIMNAKVELMMKAMIIKRKVQNGQNE